jgi:hypothetical protein
MAGLPDGTPLIDMVALCAQDWAARIDQIPDVLFERVKRGTELLLDGALRIEREGGEVRLINTAGDVTLSLAEATDG